MGKLIRWFARLQSRLIVYMAFSTFLPLIFLGSASYYLSVTGLTHQAENLTKEIIEERALSIEHFTRGAARLAYNISQNATVNSLLETLTTREPSGIERLKIQFQIEEELRVLLNTNSLLALEIVVGDTILGVGETSENYTDKALLADWQQRCESTELSLCWLGLESNPHEQSNEGLIIPALYQIKRFDEASASYISAGSLILKYSVGAFYDFTYAKNQSMMYHTILDGKNRVVYHPLQSRIGRTMPELKLNDISDTTGQEVVTYEDEIARAVVSQIPNTDWHIVGIIPLNTLEKNAILISHLTLGCLAFSLALMAITTVYIARRVILPIRSITDRKNDPNETASTVFIDSQYSITEIKRLVDWYNAYNQVVSQEREQQRELAKAYERLKKTQNQLIESEKMAALGNLVAGVAHEINTPLGVSITACSMVTEKTKQQTKLLESGKMRKSELENYLNENLTALNLAHDNLHRAAQLVQTFKQVAVDQHQESRQLLNLECALNDVKRSLQPQFKNYQVELEISCGSNLQMMSYPGILWQVFSNLIMNSYKHGFTPSEAGNITIDVAEQSDHLLFTYKDDGKGIATEHLGRIFEPFYTTKRGDGGSGLGLHIIYNLITQNLAGEIHCDSAEGQGVVFEIRLPKESPEKSE
ncbi:ATP-binding protein [Corallincola platygyrae]|uniref:histidine kinase n=1 Tax=Corallincola platygyrae TaxID=1193278 RepID=A0ABW4XN50_9GAMM